MTSLEKFPNWDEYSKLKKSGLKPEKNLPEYDPYTGDRNPYLIDTKVPKVSRLSVLYYIFLLGSVLSCANLALSILLEDGVLQIIAWSCAVVYSIGCSIYEYMRCKRML